MATKHETALRDLAKYLRAQPNDMDQARRFTLQTSMAPGYLLARIEIGEFGHGACVWYGKAKTPHGAIQAMLSAIERPQSRKAGR